MQCNAKTMNKLLKKLDVNIWTKKKKQEIFAFNVFFYKSIKQM